MKFGIENIWAAMMPMGSAWAGWRDASAMRPEMSFLERMWRP
jgi:hypothetical protein